MPAGTKASGGTTLLHDIRPSWSKVCSCLIAERLHVIACNARGYHSATKNFFTISPDTAPSHLRGVITIYAYYGNKDFPLSCNKRLGMVPPKKPYYSHL
nr:unnamed protein product [Callosobruchus chinensis]